MMHFRESDATSCDNPVELNEEFEAQYDTAHDETKIARLLHHAYDRLKPCTPYCTISWVHQFSMRDLVGEKPRYFPPSQPNAPCSLPLGVKLLTSVFPPDTRGMPKGTVVRFLAGAAMKVIGIR